MEDAAQDVGKTDNPTLVFIVGVTAGYIATILPPLISYLSTVDGSFDLTFFGGKYFLASSFFAVIIGISMVWLTYGKKETTRNIFMTALALPSVLSGAINMSSATVSGKTSLQNMENSYTTIEKALEDVSDVSKIPITDFTKSHIAARFLEPETHIEIPQNFALRAEWSFKSKTQHKHYVVIVDESEDEELMKSRLEVYLGILVISDLVLESVNNKFYIIQNVPRTRSLALIEILKLNRNYNLKAKLAKIK